MPGGNGFRTGGHLASNLGVVELSIALHRTLNSRGIKLSGTWGTNRMYIKS